MADDSVAVSQLLVEVDRQVLSERLRAARQYLGLKQDEVAKALGIPRSALFNIEAGARKVDAIEFAMSPNLDIFGQRLIERQVGYWTGYIQGLLDGIEFKQTAYALDHDSRKAALARFLKSAAGGGPEEAEEERRLAA